MRYQGIVLLFVVAALPSGVASRPAGAQQNWPGAALIENAAQQINSVAPPVMTEQVIDIGAYDGATKQFSFRLEDYYPPNLPHNKRADEGGPVQPWHRPNIASYNVVYRFAIRNTPSGFSITVTLPLGNGSTVDQQATINAAHTEATVRFNPHSFGFQRVRIHRTVQDTVVELMPHLSEQLGAFVVPYMLVAIVYEPPGSGSTGNYSQTKTQNTVMSWSATRTSGIVATIDPGKMDSMFVQAMAAGVNAIVPGAGTVLPIIADLRDQQSVTKTTSSTVGTSHSTGVSIAVDLGYNTVLHQYPGNGDLFIVLHDVLFVYLAMNGSVSLTPMAYAGPPDYLTAGEMKQKLPPPIAQTFLAMDPHFSNEQKASARAAKPEIAVLVTRRPARQPRLVLFTPSELVACKHTGSPDLTFTQADFQTSGTSATESETEVTHSTGLMASIMGGGGDALVATSYTTAHEQGSGQAQSTKITLLCSADDEFWVHVYLDNTFRTFYTLRGDPLSTTAAIAGTAQTQSGQSVAGQQVRLSTGGHTYVVSTDKNGNFTFPIATLPTGPATLSVGKDRYALTLTGAHRELLLKGGTIAERPVAGRVKRP